METDIDLSRTQERTIEWCCERVSFDDVTDAHFELRLSYAEEGDRKALFAGTIDLLLELPDRYRIYDYKTGWGASDRRSYWLQSAGYYVLACRYKGPKPADVSVVKPSDGVVYTETFQPDDIPKIIEEIKGVIEIANTARWWEHLNPDPNACRWCKARATCPASLSMTTDIATIPTTVDGVGLVRQLGLAEITRYRQMVPVVEDICKQIKKECTRRAIEEGVEFEGFKLVEVPGDRFFPDIMTVYNALMSAGLMDGRTMIGCGKYPVTKVVESAVDTHIDRVQGSGAKITKKDATAYVLSLLERHIRRKGDKKFLKKG